jgi:myo-inositol 2-dehydrogenase/D-chiro-inositol 1-dehydrogenase
MGKPLGVGIIGCGMATQAIHLPALEPLRDGLSVVRCTDPDPRVADAVARRTGAHVVGSVEELIADADVDVLLIASPEGLHADHVVAGCAAEKRAILCEKPLAGTVDGADRIIAASESCGVPVIVATMHRYDAVLERVIETWPQLAGESVLVRSTAFVAPNALLARTGTDFVVPKPPPAPAAVAPPDPEPAPISLFRALALGVATHHFPLARLAFGDLDSFEVEVAMPLETSGYEISLRAGERRAELTCGLSATPRTQWSFEFFAADVRARIEFPSGFRTSESAQARVWMYDGTGNQLRLGEIAGGSGYRREWERVRDVANGVAAPIVPLTHARDDVALALRCTDRASELAAVS